MVSWQVMGTHLVVATAMVFSSGMWHWRLVTNGQYLGELADIGAHHHCERARRRTWARRGGGNLPPHAWVPFLRMGSEEWDSKLVSLATGPGEATE